MFTTMSGMEEFAMFQALKHISHTMQFDPRWEGSHVHIWHSNEHFDINRNTT